MEIVVLDIPPPTMMPLMYVGRVGMMKTTSQTVVQCRS